MIQDLKKGQINHKENKIPSEEIFKIYMITICDYIAGMTDNNALDEYKALYLVD